jgi:hypothetical protein
MSLTYLYNKSYNKSHSTKASRRERLWTTLGGLLPPSPDILGALALIRHLGHHHRLPPGLLLHLLYGLLLLPLGLLLLPSSIDILS